MWFARINVIRSITCWKTKLASIRLSETWNVSHARFECFTRQKVYVPSGKSHGTQIRTSFSDWNVVNFYVPWSILRSFFTLHGTQILTSFWNVAFSGYLLIFMCHVKKTWFTPLCLQNDLKKSSFEKVVYTTQLVYTNFINLT